MNKFLKLKINKNLIILNKYLSNLIITFNCLLMSYKRINKIFKIQSYHLNLKVNNNLIKNGKKLTNNNYHHLYLHLFKTII